MVSFEALAIGVAFALGVSDGVCAFLFFSRCCVTVKCQIFVEVEWVGRVSGGELAVVADSSGRWVCVSGSSGWSSGGEGGLLGGSWGCVFACVFPL